MCRLGYAGMVLEVSRNKFCAPCVKSYNNGTFMDPSYLRHSCGFFLPAACLTAHGFPPGRRLWDSQDLSGDD